MVAGKSDYIKYPNQAWHSEGRDSPTQARLELRGSRDLKRFGPKATIDREDIDLTDSFQKDRLRKIVTSEFVIENTENPQNLALDAGEFKSDKSALFSIKLKPKLSGEHQRHLSTENENQPGSAIMDRGADTIGKYNSLINGQNVKINENMGQKFSTL